MGTRLDLHQELTDILGSSHAYYQPPESIKLTYPCIVYSRSSGDTDFADNSPYRFTRRYQITVIDKDPDSDIPDKIATHFPMCVFDRVYMSDNLNHFVLNLYY